MGLRDTVMQHLTGEAGTRYVDEHGTPYATFPKTEGQDGPTAEIEILRGTFAGILVDALPDTVGRRYGDFIAGAEQDGTGVNVRYDSGAQERFDLVVVAEGRSSRTRRILFADETEYRDHGVSIAYGTLDRIGSDTDHWDWYTAPRGRVASIRPDNEGTIRGECVVRVGVGGLRAAPRRRAAADPARALPGRRVADGADPRRVQRAVRRVLHAADGAGRGVAMEQGSDRPAR
ncbi:hypothetical protein Q9Q99_16945 [Curtobacterium flaccumfaciens]|nr:hypothetical protein Q9Q99_16945 [Curtobacterium flaccumfaciens]